MDPKLLVKSSKIIGSAPKIQFRKNQKNRPSSFELEKCFLKPHSSKTQIALVTRPGGSRRRSTEPPRQAFSFYSCVICICLDRSLVFNIYNRPPLKLKRKYHIKIKPHLARFRSRSASTFATLDLISRPEVFVEPTP